MSHKRLVLSTKEDVIFSQLEDAELDYTVNWANRIGALTISSSTWEAENSGGLQIGADSISGSNTKVRLSGDDSTYLLTNTITLSDSQVMQFQFLLNIKSNDRISSSLYFSRDYH